MVTRRPAVKYQFLISVLSILMVNALLTSLAGFWKLPSAQGPLMLYSTAAVAFAWLGWRFPWAAAGLMLAALVGTAAGVLTGRLPGVDLYVQTLATQAVEFSQSIAENQLDASFGTQLGMFFIVAIGVMTSLVAIPESLGKGNTFWVLAAGTFIFGTQWAWYYDASWTHFMAFTVLGFLIWILAQAGRRDADWAGGGRKIGYPSHVITPLAWVLVMAIFAMVLPSQWEPIDLGAWGERAQEAFPVLKSLRGSGVGVGGGRFSLRATGFSPNLGVLGGPVRIDNTVALHYTPEQAITEPVYLRGATYQVYDGRTWTRGKPLEIEVPKDGTLPSYFGSDVIRTYATAKVTPAINMGFTVFNLWEPMQIKGLKNGFHVDADGYIWSNKAVGKGTSYEIFARVPRYSGDHLRRIGTIGVSDEYAPYLTNPEDLPDRVRQFTQTLTASAPTPYDKAAAIEGYLRSLAYDLDAEAPPEGRDFVDFFLFDLKRGYCVYSATAMAVMLREVGIPSRMVEGFAIPTGLQYTEDAGGRRTYTVLNAQAHAWVEAYFPTYGWVTFDPTPRGDLPPIDRSAPAPQEPDSSSTPSTGSDTPSTDPNQEEDFMEGRNNTPEDGGFVPAQVKREWPWAVVVLAALGALLALAWRRVAAQDRIAAREGRVVVQEVWNKTGNLMTQFDVGPKPHQTATEYATDLGERWPTLKEPASVVAQEYTEARFAPPSHALTEQAADEAKSFWTKVHEVLFDKFGWRRYFWRRLRRQKKA
ncbi:MAG TPA: transglutaminaseTgpA domain-containing protein [Symbiobacteriaceae bacterium]|nr:transglutaminaseTgpA domain-containing protein [Symbiobacteriaceae bacterium]